MCMVGDQPEIFCITLDRVRRDVGVAVDPHRSAVKGNNLLGTGVVEVKLMVDLAFEEERGRSVGLKFETEPEEGALTDRDGAGLKDKIAALLPCERAVSIGADVGLAVQDDFEAAPRGTDAAHEEVISACVLDGNVSGHIGGHAHVECVVVVEEPHARRGSGHRSTRLRGMVARKSEAGTMMVPGA
jgi:hypothetical protein